MKPQPDLRQRALAILARREISRAELAQKLQQLSNNHAEINALLDELAERHWQSDTRYAEAYINSKARSHGNLRLQQALAAKGVDADTIRQHLPDADTQQQAAIAVLHKKFNHAPADMAEKHKQMRFLAYCGFDMHTIQAALKQAWAEEDE